MKKVLTLVYLFKEDSVCLGFKKRGFGEGNWNGYGGKLEEGESILDASVRELFEESSVVVKKENLEQVSIAEFFFEDGKHLEVHTFFAKIWEGEPVETEEMRPEWFTFENIPYEKMWADDEFWFPRALKGEKLRGKVWFDTTGKNIKNMEWIEVESF